MRKSNGQKLFKSRNGENRAKKFPANKTTTAREKIVNFVIYRNKSPVKTSRNAIASEQQTESVVENGRRYEFHD
jgi:hypothetical protein